jgi:zinc-ribbon family
MITIFGDKSFTGKKEKVQNVNCINCNSNNIEITCYHSYYHIFFVPVFPNKKIIVAQCSNCGDIQSLEPKENKSIEDFSKRNANPLWMWIGLPVYLSFFAWIAFTKLYPTAEKKVQECFSNIQPTEVFEIKSKEGKKQLLKIKYIDRKNNTLMYVLGQSQYNINESINTASKNIEQEFKNGQEIEVTESNFKQLPIINCH